MIYFRHAVAIAAALATVAAAASPAAPAPAAPSALEPVLVTRYLKTGATG